MLKLMPVAIALAMSTPVAALAQPAAAPAADLAAMRKDMEALRAAYEQRLQALEQRLRTAEAALGTSAAPTGTTAAVAPPSPAAAASPAPLAARANAFNPAISLILSGLYTRTSKDPSQYTIGGFQLPGDAEVGPGTRGPSLSETELSFSASIDPWLRGAATVAVAPDSSVSVEEAYVQTTSLGNGLSLKAGRFFSGVGYLNPQHAHTWDFVDSPLAYQAMLGSQYGDDGAQLAWLAPLDRYVELGLEVGRGRSFPGTDTSRNGAGMWAATAHTGGDVGASHSWRAGVSLLNTKANEQGLVAMDAAGTAVENVFSGRTRVWVADAVWKWAPNGNATRTHFKLQGEYLRSTWRGDIVQDVGVTDLASTYRTRQSGWYVQGVWQFMPRWRTGLRTERLDPGRADYGAESALVDLGQHRPSKHSAMLEFNPSEFSRVRLQIARDRARQGVSDTQWFLQYQMSLGAHGGHRY